MNYNLTTPQEVTATAFAIDEHMDASAVTHADITLAEERYIVPIMGRRMYERMLDGEYELLRVKYAAPAVAYFTRLLMQPLCDINTGRFGATVPQSSYYAAAERSKLLDARRMLREKARTLQQMLSDALDRDKEQYPDYRPEENILHHCMTNGGIVQVL